MSSWELVDSVAHDNDTVGLIDGCCGIEKLVVDGPGNERCGQFAEVLLERGCNSHDIQIRIRNVEVVGALEAFSDLLDLRITSRLAINTFEVHA